MSTPENVQAAHHRFLSVLAATASPFLSGPRPACRRERQPRAQPPLPRPSTRPQAIRACGATKLAGVLRRLLRRERARQLLHGRAAVASRAPALAARTPAVAHVRRAVAAAPRHAPVLRDGRQAALQIQGAERRSCRRAAGAVVPLPVLRNPSDEAGSCVRSGDKCCNLSPAL